MRIFLGLIFFVFCSCVGEMRSNESKGSEVDEVKPTISLIGPTTITLTLGENYEDPGATATDDVDGDISGRIVRVGVPVDSTTLGTRFITYNVSDKSKNAADEVRRKIFVKSKKTDTEKPIITLLGDAEIKVESGTLYEDPGAKVTDNMDEMVEIKTTGVEAIDTQSAGRFVIKYNAIDQAGNRADEVKRIVIVTDFPTLIPRTRRASWANSGVPGGIPDTSNWEVKDVVKDFGVKLGSRDLLNKIRSAINDLSKDKKYVIFFPEGEYTFSDYLVIERSNILIKGAGPKKTKITCDNPNYYGCIFFRTRGRKLREPNNEQELATDAGYTKGSRTLVVPDASKFEVGQFAEIFQQNNPAEITKDTSKYKNKPLDHYHTLLGQLLVIEKIEGNTLHFTTSLRHTYLEAFDPKILPRKLEHHMGLEDLSIDLQVRKSAYTFSMNLVSYSWVRNIESEMTNNAHVKIVQSIGCEVRDSKFSKSHNYGGGGRGYGVELGYHATDSLVINNYFYKLRHAMIFAKGANGNVFAYNYSDFAYMEHEGKFLTWSPDISNHGNYPYMNLIEGNSANVLRIADTLYHGSTGPDNVYFRNNIVGNKKHLLQSGSLEANSDDKYLYAATSRFQFVIGNALRTTAKQCVQTSGSCKANMYTDLFEHGNVIKGGEPLWNDKVPNHALPDSFFLTTKPSFFKNGEKWPMYGPDIGFSDKLPAESRY